MHYTMASHGTGDDTGLYGWAGLTPTPQNIPDTLTEIPHWLLWKAEKTERNGRTAVNKIPYKAGLHTGKASSTDPATWTEFSTAVSSYEEESDEYSGIGFVLTAPLGLRGLDFDHCVDMATGEIATAVQQVLETLGTYAELSPSGTGVRAILRSDLPITRNKVTAAENGVCDAEIYQSGRFLTITGHSLFGFKTIRHVPASEARAALAQLFPERQTKPNGQDRHDDPITGRFDAVDAFSKVLTAESLHDKLTPLAASLAAQGMPERAATALLEALLNQAEKNDPARADRVRGPELWRIVKSAFEKYRKPEPTEEEQQREQDQLAIWDAPVTLSGRLSVQPAPIEWLFRDRMQAGRGVLITGIGGSSKTRFLCQLGVGAAIGSLAWDWEVKRTGKAVLILTEDTPQDAHRTLWAICSGLGLSDQQIAAVESNVVVYALAGTDIKLLARESVTGGLVKTPHFENLEAKIAAIGDVAFIGIDPALSITEGDELNQNDQRSLGKMIDDLAVRTGAAGALVSHATKGSQQTEELSSHSSRGGGAITDAVRGEFVLRTMTASEAARFGIHDMEERKRHVQVAATKGNHLTPEAFVPMWLRRGDHGVLTLAELEEAEQDGNRANEIKDELADKALAVLARLSRTKAVTRKEWAETLADDFVLVGSEAKVKKAMTRIIANLRDRGLIESGIGYGVWHPVKTDEN